MLLSEELLRLPEVVQLQGETLARLTDRVDQLVIVVQQQGENLVRLTDRVDQLVIVVQQQGENLARLTDWVDQLSGKTDRIISLLGTSIERSDQMMAILELHARTLDEHGAALARLEDRLA